MTVCCLLSLLGGENYKCDLFHNSYVCEGYERASKIAHFYPLILPELLMMCSLTSVSMRLRSWSCTSYLTKLGENINSYKFGARNLWVRGWTLGSQLFSVCLWHPCIVGNVVDGGSKHMCSPPVNLFVMIECILDLLYIDRLVVLIQQLYLVLSQK